MGWALNLGRTFCSDCARIPGFDVYNEPCFRCVLIALISALAHRGGRADRGLKSPQLSLLRFLIGEHKETLAQRLKEA